MNILVTGGSGFIGTNLINHLLSQGHSAVNASMHPSHLPVTTHVVDLRETDLSFLDSYRFDAVVHLAAFSSPKQCTDQDESVKNNVDVTRKVLEYCATRKIPKFLLMSTAMLYSDGFDTLTEDHPVDFHKNPYCFSKHKAEKVCEEYEDRVSTTIFRLTNTYGPYQSPDFLVPQIITEALQHGTITIQNGDFVRDWLYVGDACSAITAALSKNAPGLFIIGSGTGTSTGEIAVRVSTELNARVTDLHKELKSPPRIVCDISKARRELSWQPTTSLKNGIALTIEHYTKVLAGGKP